MKLIVSPTELQELFAGLITKHKNFSCLVAWAGINSLPLQAMETNIDTFNRIIVGTHFYQTHPEFIERFMDCEKVKFVKQPRGVFHPKVYLFWSDDHDFDMLVGSPNLTQAAFTANTEVSVHISAGDSGATNAHEQVKKTLDTWWEKAGTFDETELYKYRIAWHIQRPKLQSLSDDYSDAASDGSPFYLVPVAGYSWRDYINLIHDHDVHGIESRLAVIDICRRLFESVDHFSDLDPEARKFIAGLVNDYVPGRVTNAKYFGSMVGRGDFAGSIGQNNPLISMALDEIPLNAQLVQSHYNRFISHYSNLFPRNYIGTASRLLAMKRPDMFYCLTSANKERFCQAFGLPSKHINYSNYWDCVTSRLMNCDWWVHAAPAGEQERRIAGARAAFLDAIYFEGLAL